MIPTEAGVGAKQLIAPRRVPGPELEGRGVAAERQIGNAALRKLQRAGDERDRGESAEPRGICAGHAAAD
jgi:hypothetical protein